MNAIAWSIATGLSRPQLGARWGWWLSLLVGFGLQGTLSQLLGQELKADPATVSFADSVRPLLSDRCFACHGPDEQHREAELRLDDLPQLLSDQADRGIVVPGDAEASELVRRIFSQDADEIMPPPDGAKPLSAEEKQLLVTWIEQGAVWEPHWAYRRPAASLPPAVLPEVAGSEPFSRNWIDAYVAEKQAAVGGQFSPTAEPITLARRLAFDLTGLPPTEQDLRAIASAVRQENPTAETGAAPGTPSAEADVQRADEALDQYVERLLASPRFGERLASYWLDLVRFADTVGYHGDQDHSISPYRDYVIDSLNDNKPFDQFTVEQLAGDLLPAPTEEQIIATGYNRLLQTSHEGGIQPKEYLAIYQADRVRNLSAVWFGATIGCAQCHDHKYDPFTAKDFYALAAFFADVDEAQHFKLGSNALPTRRPPEKAWLSRQQRQVVRLQQAELDALLESSDVDQTQIDRLEQEIASTAKATRLSMITVAIEPREVRLLPRGNWLDDSGPLMEPAVPAFLGSLPVDKRATRLDLGLWLTDAEDGYGLFTARVFVNRLWMLLIGRGLSPSVEDFGGQGVAPSHPQLLDRLAIEFVSSGWDIKHLVRLIVSSHTYRQSSVATRWQRQHDPENRWLTRQNRFRLPAEMIRDAALQVGGLLVSEIAGGSIKPYQPAGYYRHLNFPTRTYQASQGADQYRRGVYMHWQRQFLHPMLRAFDAPMREECSAQRTRSNTPLAALVALNDPSFIECARGLAALTLGQVAEKAGADARQNDDSADEQGLKLLFRRVTSRDPDSAELQALEDLLTSAREVYAADGSRAEAVLKVGAYRASGSEVSALAAWTTVARAVMNLSESMTRN